MRTQFTNELVALAADLTRMCRTAHDAVGCVTQAVTETDLTATYEVFALDEQLQKMYGACEARTVVLLALQAPVARDLRHVVTTIQVAGELSRISTLAGRIADQVYSCHPQPMAVPAVLDLLAQMGALVVAATARAVRAVSDGRHTPVAEATALTTMRELNQELHRTLNGPAGAESTASVIDLALVGHHFERVVDHTARIERLIHFLDTGIPPTAQQVSEDEETA